MSKSNGTPKQERKRFTGRVLGVSSGDTVTVLELDNVNTKTDEPPALLELTLSSIQAPLLGRQKNPDEVSIFTYYFRILWAFLGIYIE